MSKHRNYIFTHNNYENTLLEDNLSCKFISYSKEVAPTTGTLHLQGYVCFRSPTSINSARKKLRGCHVEVMHGTIADNDKYISKFTCPVDRGDKPISNENKGRTEQLRWDKIKLSAQQNKLDEIDSSTYVRYYSTLKRIAQDSRKKPVALDTSRPGIWIHGPTRTGKSHSVHTAYPGAFMKQNTKWWDGYDDEEVVYLEDFSKFDVRLGCELKRWVDKWPFAAEVKGGHTLIRPKKVIVTSNYSIEDIFEDDITRDCLNNRFQVIYKDSKEQNILI